MENVVVTFPSQTERYGTVAPGGVTAYRSIERTYSYAKIEATINGQPAVLQPIDFVGETLLGPGRYTYSLDYNLQAQSQFDRFRFQFIED
jgi:hypothetical protein